MPTRRGPRPLARAVIAIAFALATSPASAQERPAAPAAGSPARAADATPAIGAGSAVRIDYTLKDATGAVLDSTRDREPLRYVQGNQDILPGLERALEGLHAGAETKVILTPDEAYGYPDANALTEVPKGMVPPAGAVVGTRLTVRNQAGDARQVMVKEIKDNTIVLDMNHPLAGKTLVFEVKVVEVKAPEAGTPAGAPTPAAPPAARPGR